jgi:AsmA protein
MKIALAAAGLLIAILVIIPFLIDANTFRPLLEKQLTTALARQVKVGDLSLSLFTGSLVASDLSIAADPNYSTTPFLTSNQLRIGVELGPLIFSRQLKVRSFAIVAPQVHLVQGANGSWNFSSIGRNAAGGTEKTLQNSVIPNLTVGLITVEDGRAVVDSLPKGEAPRVFEHLNLAAQQFSMAKQFSFTLSASLPGDAKVTITGNAGPINQQDAAMTALDVQMFTTHLDPVAAGFLDAKAGISVLADIEAHATFDGQKLSSSGKIHMEHLQLRKGGSAAPNAVDLNYAVTQGLKDISGELQDATLNTGNVAIHLSGNYQLLTANPILNLKLTGLNLPIDELQALMTAAGVKLPNGATLKGGTLTIAFEISGPADVLVIAGPAELKNTRMVGFDLGSRLHGIAAMSGLKTGDTTSIETLRLNLRITNAGVQADNIHAIIPAMGELTGKGTVSPASALDFRLTAKITTAQGIGKAGVGLLTKLNESARSAGKGAPAKGVPMLVTGTANEPVITADVGGLLNRDKAAFLAHFGKKK